jgi:hypothetical protein
MRINFDRLHIALAVTTGIGTTAYTAEDDAQRQRALRATP